MLHPQFATICEFPKLHSQQERDGNSNPRIVIIGGGFGGLFTALDIAGAGDVTLISDADHFLFTPMLYEYLSGEVEGGILPRNMRSCSMIG